MASKVKLSHLETADGARVIPVNNIAEMNGGFSLRNKIHDGRFDLWYEGVSKAVSGSSVNGYFTTSMSRDVFVSGNGSFDRINLSPGEIDVPTAAFAKRVTITSITSNSISQVNQILYVENVRTLSGRTATVSFYARADAARDIAIELVQNFGSAGSSEVNSIGAQKITLTTQLKRHTVTFDVPDVSGKTIDASTNSDHIRLIFWFSAGSSYSARTSGLGEQTGVFDIACVQLEDGSVATPFEELPIALSKQLVSRYVQQINIGGDWCVAYMNGTVVTTNPVSMPEMRAIPTASAIVASQFTYRTVAGVAKATPTAVTVIRGLRGYQLRLEIPSTTYAAGDYIGDSTGQNVVLNARL